jgi:streptogramin lyase
MVSECGRGRGGAVWWLAAGVCAASAAAQGECIYTVAGTGVAGASGDGGPARQATLTNPVGLALTGDGSLWIADSLNHRIRRIWTNGTITTVAGTGVAGYSGDGGPAVAARLNEPYGVAAATDSSVAVADRFNHAVRRISAAGIITTVAGTGVAGYSGDGGLAIAARFNQPLGVAWGPDGSLWSTDYLNHRVRRLWPNGTITTIAGTGSPGFSGDGGPATAAQLNGPYGIRTFPDRSLWVTEWAGQKIRRIWPNGTIATVAGAGTAGFSGDGGPATGAQFNGPLGVDVPVDAPAPWVSDFYNHRLRRIWPDGRITTVAGTGTAGYTGDGGLAANAQIHGPVGIAASPQGGLWIADYTIHVIRRILPAHMCGAAGLGALRGCLVASPSSVNCSLTGLAHLPPLNASTPSGPCATTLHPTHVSNGTAVVVCPVPGADMRTDVTLSWTLQMGTRAATLSCARPSWPSLRRQQRRQAPPRCH